MSVHISFFLLLLSLHTFPLLCNRLSMGGSSSRNIHHAQAWSSMGCRGHQLQHLEHLLPWCPWCSQGCFSLFFFSSFLSVTFCLYWTRFARAAPTVAVGPGHALHGAIGAVWNQLCLAWGSTGLASLSGPVAVCYQYLKKDARWTHPYRMEENSSKRLLLQFL